VITIQDSGFVVDYYLMTDFCRALEKCNPKNDYVYLSYDGSVFSMFSQTVTASVIVSFNATGGKTFSFGVESAKFLSLWKKLYPGSQILFKPSREQLIVSEDNISVKFPTVQYTKHYKLPEMLTVSGPGVEDLAKALSTCEGSVSNNKQAPGILIDNTASRVCRVVKIGNYSYRMCSCNKPSFGNSRIVVSDEFCEAVSALSKWSKSSSSFGTITAFLVSPNKVGAVLNSGVQFYMPTLHDAIPASYVYDFRLLPDSLEQVAREGRVYTFSQKRLSEVLDLVAAVIGTEESMLLLEIDGVAAVSGNPVFKISARTHDGCEVSELVETLSKGPTDLEPFRINKNQAILALKSYEGSLVLIDRPPGVSNSLLVLQDEFGRDVTFLLKAPA
jgi:hypothetical protein